jgi:hypothetical protein
MVSGRKAGSGRGPSEGELGGSSYDRTSPSLTSLVGSPPLVKKRFSWAPKGSGCQPVRTSSIFSEPGLGLGDTSNNQGDMTRSLPNTIAAPTGVFLGLPILRLDGRPYAGPDRHASGPACRLAIGSLLTSRSRGRHTPFASCIVKEPVMAVDYCVAPR